jgi:hypothetical protein
LQPVKKRHTKTYQETASFGLKCEISFEGARDASVFAQVDCERLAGLNFQLGKTLSGGGKANLGSMEGTMNSRAEFRGQRNDRAAKNNLPGGDSGLNRGNSAVACGNAGGVGAFDSVADLARIPEGVRASVLSRPGEYDARRLRSQREIIRDVMISAAECGTWLTLGELRALTRYGEASISAQLRHLRKTENGGYDVAKRHREGVSPERPGADGRGECVWEYRITRDERAGERSGREIGGAGGGGLEAAA